MRRLQIDVYIFVWLLSLYNMYIQLFTNALYAVNNVDLHVLLLISISFLCLTGSAVSYFGQWLLLIIELSVWGLGPVCFIAMFTTKLYVFV